jgi:3-hydroxyisobutyrate dehydrogenase
MAHVALLGTGIMGSGMVKNLLKENHNVTVWNRTAAKAAPLVEAGAALAASPAQAARNAEVIISIVGEDDASRAVWLGEHGVLAGQPAPGTISIESTTISLDWVTELNQTLTQAGLRFIDSPVTGGSWGAEAGTLTLLVGADESVLTAARPVLAAYSQKIIHFGPAGAGTTFKLLYNLMGAAQLVALSEGLLVAEKAGLNMEAVVDGLTSGFTASPGVKAFATQMVEQAHDTVNFSANWMRKDTTYALKMYSQLAQAAPLSAVAAQMYQLTVSQGMGDKNLSAVIEALRD